MVAYGACERCGVYTDDGGTRFAVIEGELRKAWLCPSCFDEDELLCSYCGEPADRFAAGGGVDKRCCCASPDCVEKFERDEELTRFALERAAEVED